MLVVELRAAAVVRSQNSSTNPSTPWSKREGGLRGLCPDVPVVKTCLFSKLIHQSVDATE
jgi:hypothetical protein